MALPFQLVGMDLIGKVTLTSKGHQYICVLVDYFTKWPQAYPLRTKSAPEVTQCLIKFVHQFEAPQRILTDQGKEFVNDASTMKGARLHTANDLSIDMMMIDIKVLTAS